MARKRGRAILNKIDFLLVCTCLCLAYGCSVKEPAPAPAFPASPIQVTTAATYAYPLNISANGRYLVDQNGKPFRIQGDSAQSLIANLTYAEADKYLSDRQKKGFNTVNVNLLEAKFAFHAPANRNGDAPFTKPGDFSTPNEAYFAFADSIIDLAASKGMLVSLAAMYLGFHGGDEGWWKALTNGVNTQTVCYNFGLYVGKRYKSRKNIFWVIGGDYLPSEGSEGEHPGWRGQAVVGWGLECPVHIDDGENVRSSNGSQRSLHIRHSGAPGYDIRRSANCVQRFAPAPCLSKRNRLRKRELDCGRSGLRPQIPILGNLERRHGWRLLRQP